MWTDLSTVLSQCTLLTDRQTDGQTEFSALDRGCIPCIAVKNAVSKIWTLSCDKSETVRDRMSVTINHYRKLHRPTRFRWVPSSMTLNDLERRNSPYYAFFSPNLIALQADYVTVVEARLIMSQNIVSQF